MSMRAIALAATVIAVQLAQPQACNTIPPTQPVVPSNPAVTDQFTLTNGVRLGVQTIVTNVEVPWDMAFAPDGRLFFTERAGRVRVYQNGGLLQLPALTLDDVQPVGEGGLLGIALHPNFATNHFVYLLYTTDTAAGAVNRLARFREVNNTLAERAVLAEGMAASSIHNGGRIRFGPDGMLYVTMGDAANPANAQSLSSLNGKILRFRDDGTTPDDNPFSSPVWTWGHRNPQGLDWNPVTGDLWATEHGQVGNDEFNLIRRGLNYGWPTIEGTATQPGMETPVVLYNPTVAPSGGAFYTSTRMPSLTGNFFFGALAGQQIQRVILDPLNPARVVSTEMWLQNHFGRIRDVVTGPDGALYFCTSNRDGRGTPVGTDDRIARIVPVQ